MIDTDPDTQWKPLDEALLLESAHKGKIETITLKEVNKNEFIIEVKLSWRTEPSRLCFKRYKTKPRIFKSLDRLKVYMEDKQLTQQIKTILLELQGND